MRRVGVLLIVVACADPPESDLDGDGIADAEDTCIAGFPDDELDADGDKKDTTQDLCPHDPNALAGDLDFDGIPDACDPFPATAAKDTRRCITGFRVGWMNAAHLDARAGEAPWTLRAAPRAKDSEPPPPALVATATQSVSVVSAFAYDYPSVTYDVVGTMKLGATSGFKLWLQAEPTAISQQDIACSIDVGADGTHELSVWARGDRHVVVPLNKNIDGAFRLRGTIQNITSSTVLCRVSVPGAMPSVARYGTGPLIDGRYGFASTNADVTIESLVVDTNDVPQPF